MALAEGRVPLEALPPVESHLSACPRCRGVVAQAARLFAPDSEGSLSLPLDASRDDNQPRLMGMPLASGTRVSRYRIGGVIGSGAAGIVYRAYDPELERHVALKFLRAERVQAHRQLKARLLREAQAMAQVSHPNVVSVFDVGTYEEEIFLVLELVQGQTLAEWLDVEHGWRDVIRVFLDAGKGLAAAHAVGLVHRDFKPANVLIGADGRVCVTDFGLAAPLRAEHLRQDAASERAAAEQPPDQGLSGNLTQTKELLGTPLFMAPEQFAGARGDERTDQFAFCVSLYAALFGAHPYLTPSAPARPFALAHLVECLSRGELRVPSGGEVPRSVFGVLRRGLGSEPRQRFHSLQALLDELRGVCRPARRAGHPLRSWVVLAATLGLSGLGFWGHAREGRAGRLARHEFKDPF